MSTRSFELSGPIQLMARLRDGSVTVTAADDITSAEVTLTARDPSSTIAERVVVEQRGPVLAVVVPRLGRVFDLPVFGRRDTDALDVTVLVPSGTETRVSVFTADVTLAGQFGPVHITAGSSRIQVDTVEGNLTLRYGSGSAGVQRVTGTAEVRAGSGSTHLGEVDGTLTCSSGSGDLSVERSGGALRGRTGSGTARIAAAYGDVDLASGSGSITVGVPAGVSVKLDAVTGSGNAISELPVDPAPAVRRTPITLRARTGSGHVRIVPAA